MLDVVRYISFLKKNKLNQQQFLALYLLHIERYDLIADYKEMFPTEDGSFIGKHSLQDLIDREFLVHVNPKSTNADAYKITDKFTHIFIDKFECGRQLWDAYPAFVMRKGVRYTLNLHDEDEIRDLYAKKIQFSREEHDEVMKDLEYAKENNLIVGTIRNFVVSRQWRDFRKERLNLNGEENERFKRETI